ncbi:putative protein-like [Forsythia ovata]|uniref:Uncharacterized protein n=1 Tax=Forsythia ovata TaxID=205694 RepID=A0ABD1UC05_9LAMI
MAPTSDEELKLMLYSGELSQLGPADRFLEVLQFSEFVNARNLALESVNLDHRLIWRTGLPSILDDIEDRDEESDGSLRGRFKLEIMRSSHPMYFAKKPTEPSPALAIQGLLRLSFMEQHSVIQKYIYGHQSSNTDVNQISKEQNPGGIV